MLSQLGYFHTLEDSLNQLKNTSHTLKQKLDNAFTSADQQYCTLNGQLSSIINEAQQVQIWAEDIMSRISSNSFVPVLLDEYQVKQLLLSASALPSWFSIVLEEQYSLRRTEFSSKASQLAKKYRLQEKIITLREQRARLTTLNQRNNALSDTKVEQISLREELIELKNRVSHVRKSFQFYCNQVANQLKIFLSDLANKSKNIHSNKEVIRQEIKNNYQSNLYYVGSKDLAPEREPAQLFRRVSPQNKTNRNLPVTQNESEYQAWQDSRWLGDQSKKTNRSKQTSDFIRNQMFQPSFANTINYDYKSPQKSSRVVNNCMNHSREHECRNHYIKSPDLHKHTCGLSSGLKRLNSAGEMRFHSPRNGHNFNYRTVIGSHF